MPEIDAASGGLILAALLLGGTIKGATGAGAPVVAVPVMATFFDVRLAVVIMVVPNILSNIGQLRKYRAHRLEGGFDIRFALAGALGALAGTVALAFLPARLLTIAIATAVLLYVTLRIVRPGFALSRRAAWRWVWPAGTIAGMLQGAAGLSAPVSISFLNAMRLARPAFIVTISAFFVTMSIAQLVAQSIAGLMTPVLLAISFLALVPILIAMPLGARAARHISPASFDRLILIMLSLLALRLLYTALA